MARPSVATDWWVAGPAITVAAGSVGSIFLALLQIGSERKHRHHEERVSQARLVAAWPGLNEETGQAVILHNGSNEPVYQAVATLVFIQGAGAPRTGEELHQRRPDLQSQYQRTMGLIPPGRSRVTVATGWGAMGFRPAIEVAFTDRAGVHWVRRGDGQLQELPEPAFDHFDVLRPMDLETPEPIE